MARKFMSACVLIVFFSVVTSVDAGSVRKQIQGEWWAENISMEIRKDGTLTTYDTLDRNSNRTFADYTINKNTHPMKIVLSKGSNRADGVGLFEIVDERTLRVEFPRDHTPELTEFTSRAQLFYRQPESAEISDFSGIWNNNKDSFSKTRMALREDGRGLFGTMPIHWKITGKTSFTVVAAFEEVESKFPGCECFKTPQTNLLLVTLANKSAFWEKEADREIPDREQVIRDTFKRLKSTARESDSTSANWIKSVYDIENPSDVKQYLQLYYRDPDVSNFFIRIKDGAATIKGSRYNSGGQIAIYLTQAGDIFRGPFRAVDGKPDLALQEDLCFPLSSIRKVKTYLTDNSIVSSEGYFVFQDKYFGVKRAFRKKMTINLREIDSEKSIEIIMKLVEILFAEKSMVMGVTVRNPG